MPLELDDTPRTAKFRAEVREWLEANPPDLPPELTPVAAFAHLPVMKEWADRMQEGGFICVSWPKEYGGRGLSGVEVAAMNEEFARAGAPRMTRGMGENLVGPSIINHGTDEQKAYFLPRIISGEDRYCQGFSEPDSGSDLASLSTRGIVDGEEIVVTGQKVWTSWYWDATMLFCLCRTDPDAPKHKGISYVLIPVAKNGVEFRPLRQITGESHFAETFLDEARAPLFNVIGGLNNGWRVAMTTLGNERGSSASTQHIQFEKELQALIKEAKARGKTSDPLVRQRLAWAYSRVEIMRFAGLRVLAALANETDPGPSASINKVYWSEYYRRLGEIAMDIVGLEAAAADANNLPGRWQTTFLQTRGHTIWGGTAEIQRNILGERVLGLPKDPAQ